VSHQEGVDAVAAMKRLSRIRLTEHSMHSALRTVADIAKDAVPGVSEVSVTVVTSDEADTVISTGQMAVDLDETQYEHGDGPCLAAARQGVLHHIADATSEERWRGYAAIAVAMGSLSSVSVPMLVQDEPWVGAALNFYATQAHAFDAQALRTTNAVAAAAEVMLANMRVHDGSRELVEHLVHAMGTRAVIEQAKGVLMRNREFSDGEAFAHLVSVSQHSHRSLRDVAQDILTSVGQQHRSAIPPIPSRKPSK
jgi:GAF domain-containing protein